MDLATIITIVTATLALAQKAIAFGIDVWPIVKRAGELLTKGKHATQAEVDELISMNNALNVELQAPIPPEQD